MKGWGISIVCAWLVAWTPGGDDGRTLLERSADELMRQSRNAYRVAGWDCGCPYEVDRNGHGCGARSAYSLGERAKPYCALSEVPPEKIDALLVADGVRATDHDAKTSAK